MSTRGEFTTLTAVAAGGVVGATARWAVGTWLAPIDAGSFPWHTFSVNVVGCLLIGIAAARLLRSSIAWAFATTGVLGGFTTMSSFAVELNRLADAGRRFDAATYLGSTLVAGLVALRLAEWLAARGHQEPADAADPEGIE